MIGSFLFQVNFTSIIHETKIILKCQDFFMYVKFLFRMLFISNLNLIYVVGMPALNDIMHDVHEWLRRKNLHRWHEWF